VFNINRLKNRDLKSTLVQSYGLELLILLFVFFYLFVITASPYLGDDVTNSLAKSYHFYTNMNILSYTQFQLARWLSLGRFIPFAKFEYILFYLINRIFVYKLLIVLSVCVDIAIFGYFVRLVTSSRKIALLLMLISVIPFQFFTTYHNALYSYNFLVQLVLAYCLLYMIFLIKYLHTKKKVFLVFSLIFFTIGLGTYELVFAFAFFIPVILLKYAKTQKNGLFTAIPYAAIYLIYLSIYFFIKLFIIHTTAYSGITVIFNPSVIFKTFVEQFTAAFPLSNYLLFKMPFINYNIKSIIKSIRVEDIMLVVMFFTLLYFINHLKSDKPAKSEKKSMIVILAIISFGLMVFPSAMLSLMAKYQSELSLGIGYIPLYIEYFGVAIFLFLLYLLVIKLVKWRSAQRVLNAVICLFLCFVILISQQNARAYINYAQLYNQDYQVYAKDATQAGLLNSIDDTKTIVTFNPFMYSAENLFYSNYSMKKVNTIEIGSFISSEFNDNNSANMMFIDNIQNKYLLEIDSSQYNGMVKLAPVSSMVITRNPATISDALIKEAYVYVAKYDNMISSISYTIQKSDGSGTFETVVKPISSFQIITDSQKGTLVHMSFNEPVVFNSLMDSTTPPEEANGLLSSVVFTNGAGIYAAETNSEGSYNWCDRQAEMEAFNKSDKPQVVHMRFDATTGVSKMSDLNITCNDSQSHYSINSTSNQINLTLTLQPGENTIKYETNAPQVNAANDPREMCFYISNLEFSQ
jgi:hypothetical protein